MQQRVRARLETLRASRQRSALGLAEIAGLLGAAVMVLAVLFAYFSILQPARKRLQVDTITRQEFQKQIQTSSAAFEEGTSREGTLHQISDSLQEFEDRTLESRDAGRLQLYSEFNEMIRSNKLRNTSGPNFVVLDALGANGKPVTSATKSGNARYQSMYPGIGVSVTVEGSYESLRHFIHDVEASHHFLIINSVQLEKAGQTDTKSATPVAPQGKLAPIGGDSAVPKSGNVSLQLELATYFKRTSSQGADTETSSTAR